MNPPAEPRARVGEDGVRWIAELARLRVEPDEIPALAAHFERMLDFVGKLQEVDVEGVEPDFSPACPIESLRADEPRAAGSPGGAVDRSQILDNAPQHQGPYFTTPKVV